MYYAVLEHFAFCAFKQLILIYTKPFFASLFMGICMVNLFIIPATFVIYYINQWIVYIFVFYFYFRNAFLYSNPATMKSTWDFMFYFLRIDIQPNNWSYYIANVFPYYLLADLLISLQATFVGEKGGGLTITRTFPADSKRNLFSPHTQFLSGGGYKKTSS